MVVSASATDKPLAFGIFAQSLPNTSEFASLKGVSAGIQLADSTTGDGHKMLNVVCNTTLIH